MESSSNKQYYKKGYTRPKNADKICDKNGFKGIIVNSGSGDWKK